MNQILLSVLISLLTSIIGAFVGWILSEPYRIPSWIALNKKDNLKGKWFCLWEEWETDNWVTDEVLITKKLGKIKIQVINPGKEYKWELTGKLINKLILSEHKSVHPNSSSIGNATLKIDNQGKFLWGYFIGVNNDEKLYVGKTIIVQNLDQVTEVKKRF